ncbi:transcriptional regulator [Amycolatopsis sp. NPDC049868]|uniref:transcriptional regulator n=1 Tax=Amycolatopsis sp. NPDC049868 TaxID=3363934 RepID=UPI003797D948
MRHEPAMCQPSRPVVARGRLGLGDVRQVEARTRTFRALDYRYGGGWCSDAVAVQQMWASRLLAGICGDAVRRRLSAALADLTNLVGWTAFDSGRADLAHATFDRALDLAGAGDDVVLVSNICYRKGRVFLHYNEPWPALAAFRRGERVAAAGGSSLMVSVLRANMAWAYAMLGDCRQATAWLGRARAAFDEADLTDVPPYVAFFGETDLMAMAGTVHNELATTADPGYAAAAITELTEVVNSYTDAMARSKAFCLTMLATSHLVNGDADHAVEVADAALAGAASLNSTRLTDRLRPLWAQAHRRRTNADARDLADRIADLHVAA